MSTEQELANYYIDFGMRSEFLVKKWAKTGLLEGLNAEDLSQNKMAIILENQTRQIFADAEGSVPGANTEFQRDVELPIVRKVFGPFVTNPKFHVAVLPMWMVPIDGNLEPVAMFTERFKFKRITLGDRGLTHSAINVEPEFCAELSEAIVAAIKPVIEACKIVVVFMPFSELNIEPSEHGFGSDGFAVRWYHEPAE